MTRLHTFFVDGEKLSEGREISLSNPELIHQVKHVFRLKSGEAIILADNSGFLFESTIRELSKNGLMAKVTRSFEGKNQTAFFLTLFPSLIKKDKLEWVIQKGTELGVTVFSPIISEHSEKKRVNNERLFVIAKEAAEQCGRGILPTIKEVQLLNNIIESAALPLIAFDGTGTPFTAGEIKEKYKDKKLGVLLGPEGGWSNEELKLFHEKKIPLYSLGGRTLRAETAAIAVSSLLLL